MSSRPDILLCPACNREIGVTLLQQPRTDRCPHCQADYIVPSVDGSTELPPADPFQIIDDQPQRESDEEAVRRLTEERESRLNSLHVAAVAGERRGKNRLRLFCIGGAFAAGVIVVQLGLLIGRSPAILGQRRAALMLAGAVVMLIYLAIWLLRKAGQLAGQLRHPILDDPATPPDFAPLQDGSQHWKTLEQMHRSRH